VDPFEAITHARAARLVDEDDEAETAPVFFVSHDPPVILYQSPDLGGFLHEALRMLVPPHSSAVDDVHEDRLFNVWRNNPGDTRRCSRMRRRRNGRGCSAAFRLMALLDPPPRLEYFRQLPELSRRHAGSGSRKVDQSEGGHT
jgi:hypothetical protein